MNTPNPLVPQGSLLEEKARSKTSLPVAFFIFLALHAVVLGGILMVGCKKEEETPKARNTLPPLTNDLPPLETNAVYTPPPAATNLQTSQPAQQSTQPPPGAGQISNPASDITQSQQQSNTAGQPGSAGGHGAQTGLTDTSAQAGSGGTTDYKVAKGDTFATIAKKFGTTAQKIAKANPGVNSSKLKIGQPLVIPAAAPAAAGGSTSAAAGSSKEGAASSKSDSGDSYTVKPGDNITKIAKSHGTTTKAIRSANGMKSDRIVVGQKLKIPAAKHASSASAAAAEPSTAAAPATTQGAPQPPSPSGGQNTPAGAPPLPRQ